MKARVKAQAFEELLENKDRLLIMGHANGDMDCLGASVGVFRMAAELGKRASIVQNRVTPPILPLKARFLNNEDYPVFIEAEGRWVLLTTPDPDVVAVISSDFHLYRASAILEAQCDMQALGVPAPSDRVLFMHYLARESIALLKDKYFGRLNKRQSRERK